MGRSDHFTSLGAVATVDVLTPSNNHVHFVRLLNRRIVLI